MKTYRVRVPVKAHLDYVVTADGAEAALRIAESRFARGMYPLFGDPVLRRDDSESPSVVNHEVICAF